MASCVSRHSVFVKQSRASVKRENLSSALSPSSMAVLEHSTPHADRERRYINVDSARHKRTDRRQSMRSDVFATE